jgi:hypothetical protein
VRRTFAVEVFDPAGKARGEYGDIIASGADGKASGKVPFALNDPPGTWKLVITEAVSGTSAQQRITLNAER